MIRNIIFFSVALIILSITALYEVNYLNYKAPIPYVYWESITWRDFRGLNRPFMTLDGEKKFAFISTEIVAEYNNEGNIQIVTYFHPSRSYVFNSNILDRGLLKHELYHFHIAEIIVRRMRHELSGNVKTQTIDLTSWQDTYQQTEDSMQRAYDYETYHGYLSSKQKMWQAKVDSSLLALSEYSNSIVKTN